MHASQAPVAPLRLRPALAFLAPVASTAMLALLLAGCAGDADSGAGNGAAGGGGASASARFDESMEDTPCKVVTLETVAGVFGLPPDEIEQNERSGNCEYSWKDEGQTLETNVHIYRVGGSTAEVAEYFGQVTQGISGADLDKAMDSVREQAREELGTDSAAADALLGAAADSTRSESGGLQFRDVEGIGDQARISVGGGDLHVLHGNLYFTVSAYHGEQMKFEGHDLTKLVSASRDWRKSVQPQREEQSQQLARAAIAAL